MDRGSIRAASCRALVGCAQRGTGLRKKLVELGWMAGGEIWGDTIPAYFPVSGPLPQGRGSGLVLGSSRRQNEGQQADIMGRSEAA